MDRFRLVIGVTRDDTCGRVLKWMSSGMVVVYQHVDAANEAADQFLTLARAVIKNVGHDEIYGVLCILDAESRAVITATALVA